MIERLTHALPCPSRIVFFLCPSVQAAQRWRDGRFLVLSHPFILFSLLSVFCSVGFFFLSFLAFSFPSTESCLGSQHSNYQADYSLKDESVFKILSNFYHPHALSAVKISNLPISPDRAGKREGGQGSQRQPLWTLYPSSSPWYQKIGTLFQTTGTSPKSSCEPLAWNIGT